MSEAVLISIRKEHSDKIFAGQKKWEGRKTIPNAVVANNILIDPTISYEKPACDVKFFVYEPKTCGGCGKVIGEFICDCALSFGFYGRARFDNISQALCVSEDFARSYFNKGKGYMFHINEPKRYEQPKSLREFTKPCPEMSDLDHEEICAYCYETNYGECTEVHTPNGVDFCEGRWCEKAYESYKEENYAINRPPQSWCYVEEI